MKQEKQEQQNDLDELQGLFEDGFQAIDRDIENNAPSEQWFEQFVQSQQETLKQKYRKELALFAFIAVLVISIVLFALYANPLMFAVIQVCAFLAAIGYSGFSYFKQVNRT